MSGTAFSAPRKDPVQLTSGPMEWGLPVFSNDGKKIFATGSTRRGELVRLDAQTGQFQPFLGGISADLIAFSKDGHSSRILAIRMEFCGERTGMEATEFN